MSTVRLPSVLRSQADGQRAVEVEGATIGDAVQALVGRHPGLAEQLLTPEGELHRFVNVYLNDTDIRHLDALATKVTEHDTIVLLPAMAGGSSGCRYRCPLDSPRTSAYTARQPVQESRTNVSQTIGSQPSSDPAARAQHSSAVATALAYVSILLLAGLDDVSVELVGSITRPGSGG